MSESFEAVLGEAAEHLSDDPHQAIMLLRSVLSRPGLPQDGDRLSLLLQAFARVFEAMGLAQLEGLSREFALSLDSVDQAWELAYQAYEVGLHDLAALVLRRAIFSNPDQGHLYPELSANLEELLEYQEAFSTLARAPAEVRKDPLVSYLMGFNAMMIGDVGAAGEVLPRVESGQQDLARDLRAMIERAGEIPEPRGLREWHYIINRSLLLHLSPHGFEEGMNGRYAMLWDTYELMGEGLRLLSRIGVRPQKIMFANDRASRILGEAACRYLEAKPTRDPELAELLIAYDLDSVQDREFVLAAGECREGQLLWSHANNWVRPYPVAADLMTLLYQYNYPPWEPGVPQLDPETDEMKESEGDSRSEAEIAADIIKEIPDSVESWGGEAPLTDFARLRLEKLRELGPAQRCRMRAGGPVPSSRFLES